MLTNYFFKAGLVAAFAVIATAGSAQTVTVDASVGSPNNVTTFNNLQTAIESFRSAASPGGAGVNNGNVAPNVVNVIATTPVIGTANFDALATAGPVNVMDEDLTVQGSGGLASCAVKRAASSTTNGGFVWRQKYNLNLKNLAIIPGDTTPGALGYFKATQVAGDAPIINVEGCVFTSNDGTNHPLTTTGLDDPSTTAPGVITLAAGNDGVYCVSRVEDGLITLNLKDTVIASYAASGNSDAIIMFMQGATTDKLNCFVNINEGCVIANAPRFGVQNDYGGLLKINGTSAKPVIFRNIGADGVWNFADTSGVTQPAATFVNYANFSNIKGSALKEQETSNRGFVQEVKNTKIANTAGPAIYFGSAGALPPTGGVTNTATIDNVVIYNNTSVPPVATYDDFSGLIASPLYNGTNSSNRNVTVTNAILAGNLTNKGIYNSSTGVYTVSNTQAALSGPNALGDDFVAVSPGVINEGSGNSNGSVTFANTTNPAAANFLVPTSAVSDWSVY